MFCSMNVSIAISAHLILIKDTLFLYDFNMLIFYLIIFYIHNYCIIILVMYEPLFSYYFYLYQVILLLYRSAYIQI